MVICNADVILSDDPTDASFEGISLGVYTMSGVKREEGACSEDSHCFVPVEGLK